MLLDPVGSGMVLPLLLDRGKALFALTLDEAKMIRDMLNKMIPIEDIREAVDAEPENKVENVG